MSLTLSLLPEQFAVCRLPADAALPDWALGGALVSITRTANELSLVCVTTQVPADVQAEQPWRAFVVAGTLDFVLTGILAGLANPLAQAGISIFALSTYDTDYVLVREHHVEQAAAVLRRAGYNLAFFPAST